MILGVIKRNRGTFPLYEDCPNCNAKNALLVTIHQEVFCFGLPWFPTSKSAYVQCDTCKKFYKEWEVPVKISPKITAAKANVKAKKWMYLFPIILLFLIPLGMVKQCNSKKHNIAKLETLKKGDIITVECETANYYYRAKVLNADEKHVILIENTDEPKKLSRLPSVSEEDFDGKIVETTIEDLKDLNSQGKIESIY